MNELFTSIMQRIAAAMPQLALVDEDYGQLEMGAAEDHYPVTFPCALIGNAEAAWDNLAGGMQRGSITITIRLAIDCYDDTHRGSGTEALAAERAMMAHSLYSALHGFRPHEDASAMERTATRFYPLPGGIKVYEHTFTLRVTERADTQATGLQAAPAALL